MDADYDENKIDLLSYEEMQFRTTKIVTALMAVLLVVSAVAGSPASDSLECSCRENPKTGVCTCTGRGNCACP